MDYYVLIDETQRGPYSRADLRHMLTTEKISMSSSVRQEGMESWVPLSSVYEELSSPKKGRKTRDYYVLLNGTQQGPFSNEQLKQMWTSGKITKTIMIWHEGLLDWRTLESMESALFPVSPSLSPLLPSNKGRTANTSFLNTPIRFPIFAVLALIVLAGFGFFHVVLSDNLIVAIIPKQGFTYAMTFVTVEDVVDRYNNRSLGAAMRGDPMLDNLVGELERKGMISSKKRTGQGNE